MSFDNRQDLVTRVTSMLASPAAGKVGALDRGNVEDEVDSAVIWLSRFVPRVVWAVFSGDGGFNFNASSAFDFEFDAIFDSVDPPATWAPGISTIRAVETPLGEQQRRLVDENDYELYPSMDAPTHLRFTGITPEEGTDNVGAEISTVHTVNDSGINTIPASQQPGFEKGIAAWVCLMESAKYARTNEKGLDGESVDYKSKSAEWRALADAFLRAASSALGGIALSFDGSSGSAGSGGAVKPYGRYMDQDADPFPYRGYVFRSRRMR